MHEISEGCFISKPPQINRARRAFSLLCNVYLYLPLFDFVAIRKIIFLSPQQQNGIRILPTDPEELISICLVTPLTPSPAARRFLDFAQAHLNELT